MSLNIAVITTSNSYCDSGHTCLISVSCVSHLEVFPSMLTVSCVVLYSIRTRLMSLSSTPSLSSASYSPSLSTLSNAFFPV